MLEGEAKQSHKVSHSMFGPCCDRMEDCKAVARWRERLSCGLVLAAAVHYPRRSSATIT